MALKYHYAEIAIEDDLKEALIKDLADRHLVGASTLVDRIFATILYTMEKESGRIYLDKPEQVQ